MHYRTSRTEKIEPNPLGMKTGIVSALNNIANGFAASYSTALQTVRGFSAKGQGAEAAKPMVNTAISQEAAKASANSNKISGELESSKVTIVA